MSVFSKLQPVFIVLAALAGIIVGKVSPFIELHSRAFIEVFLMIMLFFTFLSVDIQKISKSFGNFRFSLSALALNFVWTPVFTFILARVFLPGNADLQTGFLMLMVTPCTDWYLIFTGLAKGNVTLGSSILPLNLLLQIILLPVFLLLFMGTSASFDRAVILKSIIFVLIAPLSLSNMVKFIARKRKSARIIDAVVTKSDDIQFILLCMAVSAMFASQGTLLLQNLNIFIKLLPPLLLFFIIMFLLAFFTGKALRLSFEDAIPFIFTTSARNSPVALAIAAVTFPERPLISLALVMGPLIELPVLALDAFILKKIGAGCPRVSTR
jgi:ACR3 family arsenite efflux pump ArsB